MNVARECHSNSSFKYRVRTPIKKTTPKKLTLLEEVTILANSIRERLNKIDQLGSKDPHQIDQI